MNGALTLGQKVMFGRENGEKTQGTIIGINAKSIKVRQDEARGGRPIGTEWRVAPALVTPFEGATVAAPAPRLPHARVAAVPPSEWKVGDRVSFQGNVGLVTGTVTRINTKTVTVMHCDDGSNGYRVPPGRLNAAPTAPAPAPASRTEYEVMKDIHRAYGDLSLENLSCDGELTRGQIATRRAALRLRLTALQRELGRQVTEDQAWAWYNLQVP